MANPVTWSAQLRSTAYILEQAAPGTTDVSARTPFYQQFQGGAGGLANGQLDLRFSARYAKDFQYADTIADQGKWFVGYARYQNDFWKSQVRGGRQFIQEGTVFATMDGLWVSAQPKAGLQTNAWVGVTAPSGREFEFGDDLRAGARATWRASRTLRVGAWIEQRTGGGQTQARPIGAEIYARPIPTVRAIARGSWDAGRQELDRVDLTAGWQERRSWPDVQLQYIARSQGYVAGSWWDQFSEDLHTLRILRGSARWTDARGIGGELRSFGSFVGGERQGRIGAAFLAPHLRAGLSYLGGASGQQLHLYGDVNGTWRDRFDLAAGASFAEYALVEDPTEDQQRDLTTWFARVGFDLVEGARLTTEFQALTNPIYKDDMRLLIGLDLVAGRNATRFGIGGGSAR